MLRALLTFATVALFCPVAQASLIVGTEPEGNGGFGVGFSFSSDVNLIIGQAFTLTSAATIDSITLYLNGDGSNDPQAQFTLQVMNLIGPTATSANVLLTEVGTFPAGVLPTGHAPVTFSGLGLSLSDGTHYLVVSSAGGPGDGWGFNGPVLPSSLGTVGGAYVGIVTGGGVADYTNLEPNTNPDILNTNFRIDSAAAPHGVPEPMSLAIWSIGSLGMVVGQSWRRRRHQRR